MFENAFGIFANRFRVYLTTINLSPEKVQDLILEACCLHNFLIENNKQAYLSACDVEDIYTMKLTKGAWRNDPPLKSTAICCDI